MLHKHLLISVLLCPVAVLALEPGAVNNSRSKIEPLAAPKLLPEQTKPDFKLPPSPEANLKQPSSGSKLKLNGVQFTGNTVFSDDSLQKVAEPFVGRWIRTSELEDLRHLITKLYTDQGYINSGAKLSNQKLDQGIIEYQIIEGTLDDIVITGNGWLQESYIRKRLKTKGGLFNASSDIFNINTLRERYQLLLADPLIDKMNGQILPGTSPGQSQLHIDVTRARPYQLRLSFDNYRSPSVGAEQGQLTGVLRNLSGYGDVIDFTLSRSVGIEDSDGGIGFSDGIKQASGGFSIPLNAYNTRFHFRFDLNENEVVEDPLDALKIKSRYSGYDFGISQALYTSLTHNLDFGLTLSTHKNRTTLLGRPFSFSAGTVNGENKVSALRTHLGYSQRTTTQAFSAKVTASVGLDVFDSTQHGNSNLPDSDFLAWLGQIQYARQVMDNGALMVLKGDVQYADDKLLAIERFSVGGSHSVPRLSGK